MCYIYMYTFRLLRRIATSLWLHMKSQQKRRMTCTTRSTHTASWPSPEIKSSKFQQSSILISVCVVVAICAWSLQPLLQMAIQYVYVYMYVQYLACYDNHSHYNYHTPLPNRKVTHLGSGEFGTVDKGLWTSERGVVEVAVKTLADSSNTVRFLQEAAIMAQFRHPNIVALRGVVSHGIPVRSYISTVLYMSYHKLNPLHLQKMLVLEYVQKGDLHHYLNTLNSKSVSSRVTTNKLCTYLYTF